MENTSTLLRKATRQKAKLRIGVSGPSGSGKTYSALLMAKGLATSMDKVAVIDTENGSADLYSQLGDYNVLPLVAPYTPERYIQAITECVRAGMEVLIIDSTSHEWDGKGGCLEINELLGQTKFKGNNWAAWSETTPRHQKFIDAIVSAPCHVITTARSKTDTIQTEDKKVKKIGLKEIQREGFEYELTCNFNIDRDRHYATSSKDRTGMFIDLDPFVITTETGIKLREWAESGVAPIAPVDLPSTRSTAPVQPAKPPVDPVAVAKGKIMTLLTEILGARPTDPKLIVETVLKYTDINIGELNPDYGEAVTRLEITVIDMRKARTEAANNGEVDPSLVPPLEETEATPAPEAVKPKRTRTTKPKTTA